MMIYGFYWMEKVVIDVGGIHKSIESSADLWKDLGFKEGIGASTDEEKIKPIGLPYFIWNEVLMNPIVRWISQFQMQDL